MKEYISKIIDAMTKFSEIVHVHITPSEGCTEASAMGKEKSIMVKITSPSQPLSDPLCLGNLKYLQKILSLEQIKNGGTIKFTTGESSDKQINIVRAIDFHGPRMKIRYETTDPRAGDTAPPRLNQQNWDCSIVLQPSHSKEFNDAMALHKLVDPTKTVFRINVENGMASFIFESGGGIQLDITDNVTGEFPDSPGGYYIDMNRFSSALSLASGAESSKMSFSRGAAKMEFSLGDNEFLIVIPKLNSPNR